jgi:hypothetical protein
MNDHYLDPPDDDPEPPECCEEFMECDSEGNYICLKCGKRIPYVPDIEPTDDLPEPGEPFLPYGCRECGKPTECVYCEECADKVKCPHGNRFGDCGACDHAGDLAYDAARESR